MTYTPTIYDWRSLCAPINQIFRAGSLATQGGMTLGGASYENPEPGGRAELFMEFAPFATPEANRAASWTVSKLVSGSVFRVPLYETVQVVDSTEFGLTGGLRWANNLPWSNGQFWKFNAFASFNAAAARGVVSISVDMSAHGEVLQLGHVFGTRLDGYDFTHVVEDIEYDASDVATITFSPPLRRAATTADEINFRPTMLVQCINAREVMTNFQSGRHMQLSPARFVEALV